MYSNTPRHKVFVSYHHALDQNYRDKFERIFSHTHNIMDSKSVQIGDINPSIQTETIRQKIRNEYLRDSTVTVVLVGAETWKRKHVDWEIGISIRETQYNSRSGLLGILLPSYLGSAHSHNERTIPPRLVDNVNCGFAKIYDWNESPAAVQNWIHEAFQRRNQINPDNSFLSFANNRSVNEWQR